MSDALKIDELMCQWTSDFEDDNVKNLEVKKITDKGKGLLREKSNRRPKPRSQTVQNASSKCLTGKVTMPTIRDLCEADKLRIAELIRELGKITAEKESILDKMKTEKDSFEQQLSSLSAEKKGLLTEYEKLQEKLACTEKVMETFQSQLMEKLQCLNSREPAPINTSSCSSCVYSPRKRRFSYDCVADRGACQIHHSHCTFTDRIDAELLQAQKPSGPPRCSSPNLSQIRPNFIARTNLCCRCSSPNPVKEQSDPLGNACCRCQCGPNRTVPEPEQQSVVSSIVDSPSDVSSGQQDARLAESRRELLLREREVLERERRCLALILEQQQLVAAQQKPNQRSRVIRPSSPHSVHSLVVRPGRLNPGVASRASSHTPSSLCESVNILLPETEEETTTMSPAHFTRTDRYARRPGRSPPSPPSSIIDVLESMDELPGGQELEEEQEDEENRLIEDLFFVRLL